MTSNSVRTLLHVAYHGGRLVTYMLVGMACGLVGASIDWGGSLVGVQRMAALLVGGLMVLVGLIGVLRYSGVRLPNWPGGRWIQKWVVKGQRTALQMRPMPRATIIGLLTAFLPCGWLYMFAIVAASTSSALWGAAVMAAFWLGSVPVLTLLGISIQTFAVAVGRRIPLAISLVIVLFGLYTIGGRLTIPAAAFETPLQIDPASNTQQKVESIGQTEPPCCSQKAE